MKTMFLAICLSVVVVSAGCRSLDQIQAERLAQMDKEHEASVQQAAEGVTKDRGAGVYYINTQDGEVAAAAMARLRGQHPGQKMEKLEQKGQIGGHAITGSGAVAATVGWIVIFSDE